MTAEKNSRLLSVCGYSKSGKTTLIVELIKEMRKRGLSVGTIKSIGDDDFSIDKAKDSDTYLHLEAGASSVTAWSKDETAIIIKHKLQLEEILSAMPELDFIIIEGGRQYPIPRITTGFDQDSLLARLDKYSFAISGKIADQIDAFNEIPCFRTSEDIAALVDLVLEKIPATKPEDCDSGNS